MADTETPVKAITTILTIDEMLDALDVEYVEISVPEWKTKEGLPGTVKIGSLNAGDMLDFVEANNQPNEGRNATIRLIVKSIISPDGSRTDPSKVEELIAKFKKKDVRVINRLAEAVLILNGVKVKPGEIKNDLGEAPAAASPTVLH